MRLLQLGTKVLVLVTILDRIYFIFNIYYIHALGTLFIVFLLQKTSITLYKFTFIIYYYSLYCTIHLSYKMQLPTKLKCVLLFVWLPEGFTTVPRNKSEEGAKQHYSGDT